MTHVQQRTRKRLSHSRLSGSQFLRLTFTARSLPLRAGQLLREDTFSRVMKRALAGGFTAMILLTAMAFSADEPPKAAPPTTTRSAGVVENPGWNFKLAPNSGPIIVERPGPTDAATAGQPPFAFQWNTKLQRRGQGEPTSIGLPRVWWTGDYLTPLEKSRRIIPRSDRVRE